MELLLCVFFVFLGIFDSVILVSIYFSVFVRLVVVWCLRCVVVALSFYLTFFLDRCLERFIVFKFLFEVVIGFSFVVVVLLGVVKYCFLGIFYGKGKVMILFFICMMMMF